MYIHSRSSHPRLHHINHPPISTPHPLILPAYQGKPTGQEWPVHEWPGNKLLKISPYSPVSMSYNLPTSNPTFSPSPPSATYAPPAHHPTTIYIPKKLPSTTHHYINHLSPPDHEHTNHHPPLTVHPPTHHRPTTPRCRGLRDLLLTV